MSSRRRTSIPLGGRYRQVSLYYIWAVIRLYLIALLHWRLLHLLLPQIFQAGCEHYIVATICHISLLFVWCLYPGLRIINILPRILSSWRGSQFELHQWFAPVLVSPAACDCHWFCPGLKPVDATHGWCLCLWLLLLVSAVTEACVYTPSTKSL